MVGHGPYTLMPRAPGRYRASAMLARRAILGLYAKKTLPDLQGNAKLAGPAAESSASSVHITYGKLARRSRHRGCSPCHGRQRPAGARCHPTRRVKRPRRVSVIHSACGRGKHASTADGAAIGRRADRTGRVQGTGLPRRSGALNSEQRGVAATRWPGARRRGKRGVSTVRSTAA